MHGPRVDLASWRAQALASARTIREKIQVLLTKVQVQAQLSVYTRPSNKAKMSYTVDARTIIAMELCVC